MKVLVVYFSRSGNTRRLAEHLARELDGTAAPIQEPRSRGGFLGYQRSLFQAVAGRDAEIRRLREAPRDYDLVLIGTPIWGWHLSSPVRAFARQNAKAIRRAAFFCTMGGAGDRGAFAELERILGRKPAATLALTEAEVARMSSESTQAKMVAFVRLLRAGAAAPSVQKPPPAATARAAQSH
jgi:menaquinone-dependent protoporphyrinogen IX oxidase